MAIQTTEAILLNRKDLRETSIIASFYSRDFGKVKGILKGIRARASRYASSAELFGLNKIVFYEKTKSELNNITQCDLIDGFFGIRKGLTHIAYASYIVELTDLLTESNEKNLQIYELLLWSLKSLSRGEETRKIARIFEVRFLSSLGFAPETKTCAGCGGAVTGGARFCLRRGGVLCGRCAKGEREATPISNGAIQTLNHIKNSSLDSLLKFKISRTIEKETEEAVNKLMAPHLTRPLRSKKFIREVERLQR